jgi:hypothetical protein
MENFSTGHGPEGKTRPENDAGQIARQDFRPGKFTKCIAIISGFAYRIAAFLSLAAKAVLP